jgi:hypothetical protein
MGGEGIKQTQRKLWKRVDHKRRWRKRKNGGRLEENKRETESQVVFWGFIVWLVMTVGATGIEGAVS